MKLKSGKKKAEDKKTKEVISVDVDYEGKRVHIPYSTKDFFGLVVDSPLSQIWVSLESFEERFIILDE